MHAASSAAALAVVLHATPAAADDDLEGLTETERRELGLPPSPPPHPPPSFRRVGKALFWAGYGLDFTIAGLALGGAIAQSLPLLGPGSPETPCLGDICDRNVFRRTRHYTPSFIPVVGPIWTLGYADARREPLHTGVMAASLGMQLVGIPLYVDGVVNGKPTAASLWTLVPLYGSTERGFRFGRSF
jgi:hypothetical protein